MLYSVMYKICTSTHILVQIVYNVNTMAVNISKKLKNLRLSVGLTQEEFAEKIQVSRVNYTRYENGKVRPSYEILITIADFYDISLDDLFDRRIL